MTEKLLIVGTRKGFLLARGHGTSWQVEPLAQPMTAVYAVAIDTRRPTPRLFVSATSEHWGPTILHSDDLGASWHEPDRAPVAFPKDVSAALERVWQIQPGRVSEPDVVYAGVEPSGLFRSTDGGLTYELIRPLWDHPNAEHWSPGAGGKAIHTILPHPRDATRLVVAMSAGGVYRSFDAGATWAPANTGIKATFLPDPYPEYGQCVHKVAADCGDPERLYLQNHNGVYRSDDWGGTWKSIADGLPAEFGFPVAADPRRPGHAYVFPLVSDYFRFTPDYQCRVYGTTDAGNTWAEIGSGLPGAAFYSLVLRDALAVDDDDPAGLYVGTRSGELYAGGADGWTKVAANLPDILSVRAAVLG
jgi:hypothetical protein